MPVVLASLLGGLINIAGTLAGRVMIALGISVVTFTGISSSFTFLKTAALSSLSGLPSQLVSLMSYLGIGQAISIIFSAILARAALSGLGPTGSIKKWVMK